MTIETLYAEMLRKFPNTPIFFDHIEVEDGQELAPPYIVLTEIRQDPFYADDTTYYLTVRHTIDLYTKRYDVTKIDKIEKFLRTKGITFETSVEWLDDVEMYLSSIEVQLDPSEVES